MRIINIPEDLIENLNSLFKEMNSSYTYTQVFEWFKKNKYIMPVIIPIRDNKYTFFISQKTEGGYLDIPPLEKDLVYDTYEQAEYACLKQMISLY